MGVVAFSYPVWSARYPELALSVPPDMATAYFSEAELYCDNTPASPVRNETQRAVLLNMLTAHIASLNASINDQASSSLVGRISNASEGSVSVQAQMDLPPGSAQWFAQTKYGAAFWQASSPFRGFHYIPGRPQVRGIPWW